MTKETITKIKMGFAGIALGASLTLTGCAGLQNPVNMFSNITKGQIYESGTAELVDLESVQDENGSYTRTTIKDVNSIKTTNSRVTNAEDETSAKEFIVKFITEEALDSRALDNEAQWSWWTSNVAQQYLHPDYSKEILNATMFIDDGQGGSTGGGGVILADIKDTMPTLARDGSSRSTEKLFKTFRIVEDDTDKSILYVYSEGSAFYPVKDEDATIFIKNMFQGKEDEFIESLEGLKDGKNSILQVDFNISYTMKKHDGQWKIAGFSNAFNVLDGSLWN